jgi:hypothetical protein
MMVFTVAVRMAYGDRGGQPGVPRRQVLRLAAIGSAVAGTALASGCNPLATAVRWHDVPDRIAELRSSAVDLAGRYDRVIDRHPELADLLTPLRDAHRKHVEALDRELGQPDRTRPTDTDASAAPSEDAAAAVAALRVAETTGVRQATEVCVTGPSWHSGLVGSIAAARASHVEALT